MKQLLELQQDYIIESKLIANAVQVDGIVLLAKVYDRGSNSNPIYQKIYLAKGDIIDLAKKIKEIESI